MDDIGGQDHRDAEAAFFDRHLLDAAAQLAGKPGVSPDRVALWGYSRGAGVALNAATVSGSPIHSAVLVAARQSA